MVVDGPQAQGRLMRAHGTNARYRLGPDHNDEDHPCRCEPCIDAAAVWAVEYRDDVLPRQVDAGPVRAHLNWLRTEYGIGPKLVAKISGVSHGALTKLMYGDYGRGDPPSRYLRLATAQKLLRLVPADFKHTCVIVPAGPTLALVDRLVAAGVPKTRIAERLGQRGTGLQLASGGRGKCVTYRNATAIRAMADELEAGTLVLLKRDSWGNERDVTYQADPPPRGLTAADALDYDLLLRKVADLLDQRADQDDWRARAACIDLPSWLFFPGPGDDKMLAKAKRVCAGCPVRGECLEANRAEPTGVYGGLTPEERQVRPIEWRWPEDRPNPWIRECIGCGETFEQPQRMGKPYRRCPVCRGAMGPVAGPYPKPAA